MKTPNISIAVPAGASLFQPLLLADDSHPFPGYELVAYSGSETLGGLSAFELWVRAAGCGPPISPGQFLRFGAARHPHRGVVTRVSRSADGLRLTVGSPLELLAHSECSRTWVDQSLPHVLQDVLAPHQIECDTSGLHAGPYEPRPLTIQYRETDLIFVLRRMEQAGLFWDFDEQGRLLLRDSSTVPAAGMLPLELGIDANPGQKVFSWQEISTLGSITLKTFGIHPELPDTTWPVLQEGSNGSAGPTRHLAFDAASRAEAEARSRIFDQILNCYKDYVTGSSDASLKPGSQFTFDGRSFLVISVAHGASNAQGYRNTFVAITAETPFRPARTVPSPPVHGPLRALVVSDKGGSQAAGSNATADAQGRVPIRFVWDRPDAPVFWARVAPGSFTTLELPRDGDLVEVEFRDDDGDLDRPLVIRRASWGAEGPLHDTQAHPARITSVYRSSRPGSGSEAHAVHAIDQDAEHPWLGFSLPGEVRAKVAGRTHITLLEELRVKVGGLISLLARKGKASVQLAHLVVEAEKSITFKVGDNIFVIGPGGISLNGKIIYLNSDGGPTATALDQDGEPIEPNF